MSRRNLHAWLSSAPMPFSDAIVARREQLGWTRTRVAKAVGVSDRMLRDYEKGIALPSIEKAAAIAKTLRMSLDEACGLEEPRPFTVQVDGELYVPTSAARDAGNGGVVRGRPRALPASADLDAAKAPHEHDPRPPRGKPIRRPRGTQADA